MVWFGLLQRMQAAENILPDHQVSTAPTKIPPKVVVSYGKLPLSFEANQGQAHGPVKFLARGRGYALFLTGDEAVLSLHKAAGAAPTGARPDLVGGSADARVAQHPPFGAAALPDLLPSPWPKKTSDNEVEKPRDRRAGPALPFSSSRLADSGESSTVLRMRLVGANASAAVTGAEELPGKSNYFIGNDPKKWRTNVPNYAQVKYQNVYPGVDLVYYGNQGGQLEYDFVVAPGADPSVIALDVAAGLSRHPSSKNGGVKPPLQIAAHGDLVIKTDGGEIRFHKPVVYQVVDGQRQTVEGSFALLAKHTVGFRLASYDRGKALVIDPVLAYSTYLRGSVEDELDYAQAIAVDGAGNAYVTGYTSSTDFPVTQGAFQTMNNAAAAPLGNTSFVTKLNSTGSALVYSTYLGGSGGDYANGIAIDSSGNAYVTGFTYSTNFPVTQGAFQATNNAASNRSTNAFVTKLNPTGSALVYSTYLGGSGSTEGCCYGVGNNGEIANGLVVDGSGNAYITGATFSTNFPVTQGAFQTTNNAAFNSGSNAFVTKLNPTGSALDYSTYLGGSGLPTSEGYVYGDSASGLVVDGSGNAYITGQTYSTNFPVTQGAFQTTNNAAFNSGYNAFVTKLNPTGSALVYSTYLGGSGLPTGFNQAYGEIASGLVVDGSGNAYITGSTYSTNFPVTEGAFQTTNNAAANGGTNAFVTELNPTGSALDYSTYLGGSGGEYFTGLGFGDGASGIAIDSSGNAYVTGSTRSTNFPVTEGAFQTTNNAVWSGWNVFITKLNPTGSALDYSTYLGGSGGAAAMGDSASGLALDGSGNAYITGQTWSTNFPVTPGVFQTTNIADVVSGFVAKISTSITGPFVSLSSLGLTFGSQNLHTTSGPQTVTVTSAGTADLTLSTVTLGGTNSSDFAKSADTCSGATVTPNGTCTVSVTFTPSATGSRSASLNFTDNASNSPSPQTVTLSGTATAPLVSLSAPSLSFGNQLLSTTSTAQTETVTNTGTGNLTISTVTVGGTNASDFAKSTDTCTGVTVTPNGACEVSVTFTPSATGSRSASLNFNDNASNSPQTVTLSGTGTAAPLVSLSAPSISFNSQLMSTTSAAQAETVTNTGTANLTISAVTIGGTNASDFAKSADTCTGATVPPIGTCTVSVTFTPSAIGIRSASLSFADNASGSPQTLGLTGTGVTGAVAPAVCLTAATLTFPGQGLRTPSASQTVTLSDCGSETLTLTSIAITGSNSGDFAQTNTCGSTVGAGANCAISVTFTPTALGSRSGAITITDNAPGSPQTVSLAGTGTTAANPVPFINQPLAPTSVAPGGPGFTLTVKGTGFVSGATVNWNGVALATTFVGGEELTATVPAANIASPGTAWVTVVNPGPALISNVVFFSVTASVPTVAFSNASGSPIEAGTEPRSIAVGDFNGDGKLDLAVANEGSNNLTILLGNGDGTFTPAASSPTTGDEPTAVVVGDFNGDGKLDLAVASSGSNNLTILLGNGDGTFRPAAASPATGVDPLGVAVGDFNGDGKLDLAVANVGSNNVTILLGNGDGTFTPAASSPSTGSWPWAVAVGDFNGDGKLDLAVANYVSNNVTILLGNGDGTFTPAASSPATGTRPVAVAVGDFNGDGKLDLAVANLNSNNVTILLGNGDGTFTSAASSPTTGDEPNAVAVGDFNGDGKLDLAVTNLYSGSVTILLGNGDGTFTPAASSPATGNGPSSLAIGDFNGDGRLDLATANFDSNNVSVLLQLPPAPAAGVSTPSLLTFGNQTVGTTSGASLVTVTNNGTASLTFTSIAATGDFAIPASGTTCSTSAPVAASSNCVINVTFTPSATGSRSGSLTLTDNASGSPQTVSLSGTGTTAPLVSLSAPSLSFGSQPTSTTSAALAETVPNTGTASLTFTSIAATGDFAVAASGTTCSTSAPVAASSNCVINVTFTPTATGSRSGSLTLTDNANGSPQLVGLSGTGTAPSVSLSTTSVSFSNQPVGTTSTASAVTVTNSGTAPLTFTSLAATGDFAIAASGTTCSTSAPVAASGNCVINVTFTPAANGSRSGSLTLTDNASGSPQTVSLSGTGTGPVVSLSAPLTFSAQLVGTTSSSQTVTLTNTGNASLTFSAIAATGPFAIATSGTTCSTSNPVAAAGTCTVAVTFTPTAAGAASGSLSFSDNAPNSPQTIALSGTGQDFSFAPPSGSSTSATTAPGQPATYTLSVGGQGGLSGTVTFTCTGAPSEATCTVLPNPVTAGSSATNVTVTVTTTAATVGAPRSRPLPPIPPLSPGLRGLLMFALVLAAMAWPIVRRNQPGVSRWQSTMVLLAGGLLLTLAVAGCGGGGGGGGGVTHDPGTPAGTYTLTVTGTAGSGSSAVSHSVTLTLTVS
jgi:hypothetical protein